MSKFDVMTNAVRCACADRGLYLDKLSGKQNDGSIPPVRFSRAGHMGKDYLGHFYIDNVQGAGSRAIQFFSSTLDENTSEAVELIVEYVDICGY